MFQQVWRSISCGWMHFGFRFSGQTTGKCMPKVFMAKSCSACYTTIQKETAFHCFILRKSAVKAHSVLRNAMSNGVVYFCACCLRPGVWSIWGGVYSKRGGVGGLWISPSFEKSSQSEQVSFWGVCSILPPVVAFHGTSFSYHVFSEGVSVARVEHKIHRTNSTNELPTCTQRTPCCQGIHNFCPSGYRECQHSPACVSPQESSAPCTAPALLTVSTIT